MISKQLSLVILLTLMSYSTAILRKIERTSESEQNFMEMVKEAGYPVWKKYIDTPDGYILCIYRIPGPKGETLVEALERAE